MSETDLRRQAVSALRKLGFWVIVPAVQTKRSANTLTTGEPGMPDLQLPVHGWIETKVPKTGRLSADQLNWHARARANGVRVAVATTVTDVLAIAIGWRREDEAA